MTRYGTPQRIRLACGHERGVWTSPTEGELWFCIECQTEVEWQGEWLFEEGL